MPAGELGSILTGVYVDVLTSSPSDVRATGLHVNVLGRVTPAVLAATALYVDVLTEAPPRTGSGFTGWGIPL